MKIQMRIDHRVNTGAERQRRYYERNPAKVRAANATVQRRKRAATIPEFVGVDSEGIGEKKHHRAVLIGCGETQYVCRDIRKGLQWKEVFQFLYAQFEEKPSAAYVGFYLKYDFDQWFRTLPRDVAWKLLTPRGKASRKRTHGHPTRSKYWPVECDGWDIDTMGYKRLSIRPHSEDEDKYPWMHICDAGPFFQSTFLQLLETWDPEDPICTPAELKEIAREKARRGIAKLDERMKHYNRLENVLLARAMDKLARGLAQMGIKLAKDQWFGPGQTAQKWLRQRGAHKRRELEELMPAWFIDICRKSMYGGWFEIFSHGIIYGDSYNYDIHNAYPYAASKLPHLCGECDYGRGRGDYKGSSDYVLLYATVHAAGNRIGPVPYRDKNGNILRPAISKGWYWKHELDAAQRAGLVKKVFTHEYVEFVPCNHPAPFTDIRRLYYLRMQVGSKTALGISIKLNNNSIYGKLAQQTGEAPYLCWLYASLITADCRVQILDAIATHPGGVDSVLMVATDGVCFDSRHTSLPLTNELGDWEEDVYHNLCLFKPGVYWHKDGKKALSGIKSRGVPRDEFMKGIEGIERWFELMQMHGKTPEGIIDYQEVEGGAWSATDLCWPSFETPIKFRIKSCAQALAERKWERAGVVQVGAKIIQNSDPQSKRRRPRYNKDKYRIDTIIHDLPLNLTETTYHGEAKHPRETDIGYAIDGDAIDGYREALITARDSADKYNVPLDDNIEWEVVWDGNPV
jgi:hypothetical protein